MIRHGDYFYAFYAAAGCCGPGCTHATGVARSKSLLGPWEKYAQNPVMKNNASWKCQGHGTPIEKDGRFYFLYHGYSTHSGVFTGRQGLLSEFRFTPDEWIAFADEPQAKEQPLSFSDNFRKKILANSWEWSVFQPLDYSIRWKKFNLSALPANAGSFVAQKNT